MVSIGNERGREKWMDEREEEGIDRRRDRHRKRDREIYQE